MIMKTIINSKGSFAAGNSMLLIVVFITIFIVPVFPIEYHSILFNLLFSVIFLMTILTMRKYRRTLLGIAITATLTEWIASEMHMPLLLALSNAINIIFFITIVFFLIAQVARTKKVTALVILEAINGYLLLGMVFSNAVYKYPW